MMRWTLLLCACLLVCSCGKDDSAGTGNGSGTKATKPAEPDPAEIARKQAEEKAAAEQRAAALKAEKEKLTAELEALQAQYKAMVAAQKEEEAGLPDKRKLRTILSQLVRDSGEARGIYETDRKRLDELEKQVRASATAEIKELEKKIAEKDKEYNDLLSGAKEERVNADLGIVEETEVQKQIRTLRAAKSKWFELTRDTRRGSPKGKAGATSAFRSWFGEDPLRKTVVAMAVPQGKSPDSYDFSELEFYLYLEILEDKLDRQNIAEEKKELSQTDQKLAAIEAEMDGLREKLNEKLIEGGGAMNEYTDLKSRIKGEQEEAESLSRQVEEMRAAYAEIDTAVERNETARYEMEKQIEAAQKRLAEITRSLR